MPFLASTDRVSGQYKHPELQVCQQLPHYIRLILLIIIDSLQLRVSLSRHDLVHQFSHTMASSSRIKHRHPYQLAVRNKSPLVIRYTLEQLRLCSLPEVRSWGRALQEDTDCYTDILNERIIAFWENDSDEAPETPIAGDLQAEINDEDKFLVKLVCDTVDEIQTRCQMRLSDLEGVPVTQLSAASHIEKDMATEDSAKLRSLQNWLALKSWHPRLRNAPTQAARAKPDPRPVVQTPGPPSDDLKYLYRGHSDEGSDDDRAPGPMEEALSKAVEDLAPVPAVQHLHLPSHIRPGGPREAWYRARVIRKETQRQQRQQLVQQLEFPINSDPDSIAETILRAAGKHPSLPALNSHLGNVLDTASVREHRHRRFLRIKGVPTAQKQHDMIGDIEGCWKEKDERDERERKVAEEKEQGESKQEDVEMEG